MGKYWRRSTVPDSPPCEVHIYTHTNKGRGTVRAAAHNGPLGGHWPQLLRQTLVTFFLVSHLPLCLWLPSALGQGHMLTC